MNLKEGTGRKLEEIINYLPRKSGEMGEKIAGEPGRWTGYLVGYALDLVIANNFPIIGGHLLALGVGVASPLLAYYREQ